VADDGGSCAAFVVDRIVGRREIVVKPLRKPLEGMRGYTGAAILDDGSIALILDLLGLAGRRG
jgi:two-component system chemotaxis sensor kinase CheA